MDRRWSWKDVGWKPRTILSVEHSKVLEQRKSRQKNKRCGNLWVLMIACNNSWAGWAIELFSSPIHLLQSFVYKTHCHETLMVLIQFFLKNRYKGCDSAKTETVLDIYWSTSCNKNFAFIWNNKMMPGQILQNPSTDPTSETCQKLLKKKAMQNYSGSFLSLNSWIMSHLTMVSQYYTAEIFYFS